jgi:putative membrane protein
MNRPISLLAGALALALAACNSGHDANDANRRAMDDTAARTATPPDPNRPGEADAMRSADTAAMAGRDAGAVAQGDRKALMAVMEIDRHEIAAAEAALAKGVQGDLKSYAETLRTDHARNLEATTRLLDGHGTGVGTTGAATNTMPDGPDQAAMRRKHEAERQRLDALDGDAFAAAWAESMVKGHEEALATLDDELIPAASGDAVRQHLTATRDAVARHLETARGLQGGRR